MGMSSSDAGFFENANRTELSVPKDIEQLFAQPQRDGPMGEVFHMHPIMLLQGMLDVVLRRDLSNSHFVRVHMMQPEFSLAVMIHQIVVALVVAMLLDIPSPVS